LIRSGEQTIYLGHLAVGLAAKTTTDKVPLWAMVLAAYTNDVVKLGFKAAGLEQNGALRIDHHTGITLFVPSEIPWSHGLFMSIVWSLLAAGIAYLFYRNRKIASSIGLVVISHWLLDFIVHPPELPLLFKGSPMVGLGLWTTPVGSIVSRNLEFTMLACGLLLYLIHRMKTAVSVDKQIKWVY
jgi:hypothetical protein